MSKNNKINGIRAVIAPALCLLAAYGLTFIMPDMSEAETLGIWSTIPAIFLVVYIFMTKRTLEGLLLGTVIGYILLSPSGIFTTMSDALLETMMSEDVAWIILVASLMGSIIALIDKVGGAYAFGEWVAKRAKTKESVLMWTWLLGLVIFIDDYLNALVIGSCMAPLTDKRKSSREFLSFIVDSCAAPACVLIPLSTWGVFVAKILETNGWAPEGEGLVYFIKTIPYDFYAWVGLLIVPLFIFGKIKHFGPMKRAEERVAAGGPVAPEGSERIDIRGDGSSEIPKDPKLYNFFVPILAQIILTIILDVDVAKGIYATLILMFVFYLAQGVITPLEFWDTSIHGMKNMLTSIMLMVLAFLFAAMNEQIGFTYYMINSASRWMTPQLMPLIVFLILSVEEFVTGTNWGMYVIALPIVIPLAQALNANVALCVAAVISAGVFGSHICFYSDCTVISSAACGCDNFAHARSQAPYGILCAGISALLFLVGGFVF